MKIYSSGHYWLNIEVDALVIKRLNGREETTIIVDYFSATKSYTVL